MKKLFITLLLVQYTLQFTYSQSVGIGTATPDSSAMLEINSSNKGLLLPRIKDTSYIKNPVRGLLIYNNADNTPWYYNGDQWQNPPNFAKIVESEDGYLNLSFTY